MTVIHHAPWKRETSWNVVSVGYVLPRLEEMPFLEVPRSVTFGENDFSDSWLECAKSIYSETSWTNHATAHSYSVLLACEVLWFQCIYPCHKSHAHGIIWSYQDGLILENHPSSALVRLWLGEALFSTVAQDHFWAITLWLQRGPRVFSSAGAGAGTMKITTYVQGRWNPTGRLPLNNVQKIWRCLGVFCLESWMLRFQGDAWILGAVTDPMDSIWFHALVAQDRIEVGKWDANRSNVRALFERRPALVLMFWPQVRHCFLQSIVMDVKRFCVFCFTAIVACIRRILRRSQENLCL